jgi:hypothetical protein
MSQPKALFLADVIKADPASKTHHDEAAAELRRQHAVNAELLEALKRIADPRNIHFAGDAQVVARAAIARAEGELNERP